MLRKILFLVCLAAVGLLDAVRVRQVRLAKGGNELHPQRASSALGCPTLPLRTCKDARFLPLTSAARWCWSTFGPPGASRARKEMRGASKAARPVRPTGICRNWIQVRHDAGHGRSRSVRSQDRGAYPLAVASDDLKWRFGGIEGLPTTMFTTARDTSAEGHRIRIPASFEKDLTPLL